MIRVSVPALTVLWLAIVSGMSSTQAAIIECDDCSDRAYHAQALAAGVGGHMVYDFAHGALKQFNIQCAGMEVLEITPEQLKQATNLAEILALRRAFVARAEEVTRACTQPLTAMLRQPEAAAQAGFETALSFYWLAGNSKILKIEIGMSDFPDVAERLNAASAFNIVSDVNARIRTADWLSDGHGLPFADPLASTLLALSNGAPDSLFNASTLFNRGMHVIVTLSFPDGSSIDYDWDLHKRKPTVVAGSGEFDGNVIPDVWNPSAAGAYRFSSPDNAERFAQWLVNQNARVDRRAQSVSSRDLACVWRDEVLQCAFAGSDSVAGKI